MTAASPPTWPSSRPEPGVSAAPREHRGGRPGAPATPLGLSSTFLARRLIYVDLELVRTAAVVVRFRPERRHGAFASLYIKGKFFSASIRSIEKSSKTS